METLALIGAGLVFGHWIHKQRRPAPPTPSMVRRLEAIVESKAPMRQMVWSGPGFFTEHATVARTRPPSA